MNAHNQKQLVPHFPKLAAACGAVFVVAFSSMVLPFPTQQPDAAAKQQMVQEKVAALKQ